MARKKKIVPKREGKREVPLTPAPRPVPLGAYAVTYFGGSLSVFGWVMLGLSSIAVWAFPLKSELMAPIVFSGAIATTQGKVLSEEHIRYRRQLWMMTGRVAAVSPFSVPTVQVNFAYTVDGLAYEGFSFTYGCASTRRAALASIPCSLQPTARFCCCQAVGTRDPQDCHSRIRRG